MCGVGLACACIARVCVCVHCARADVRRIARADVERVCLLCVCYMCLCAPQGLCMLCLGGLHVVTALTNAHSYTHTCANGLNTCAHTQFAVRMQPRRSATDRVRVRVWSLVVRLRGIARKKSMSRVCVCVFNACVCMHCMRVCLHCARICVHCARVCVSVCTCVYLLRVLACVCACIARMLLYCVRVCFARVNNVSRVCVCVHCTRA